MQEIADLNEIHHEMKELFAQEYNIGVVLSVIKHQNVEARRNRMSCLIEDLTNALGAIQSEYNALPQLATMYYVEKALAILKMRPIFLEVDTTGFGSADEVCRVLLLDTRDDTHGPSVVQDILIHPAVPNLAEEHNGLSIQDLEKASTFAEAYEDILSAIEGNYLISFGMKCDEDALNKTCAKYQLPAFHLIGCDLQKLAADYWNGCGMKLEDCTRKVGHVLPTKSNQTAYDRAYAQYAVLRAMSMAIYDANTRPLPPSLKSDFEDNNVL